jgi:ribosomal protein S1
MEELLALSVVRGYKRGDKVQGKITSIAGREVLIDVGGKMEGVVGQKEWDQIRDFVAKLKPGDPIEAVVISAENEKGQMILSIKRAGATNRWERAKSLLSSGNVITVRAVEVNKGGLLVEVDGVRGFLPSSHLTATHQGELAKLVNKVLTVKVIEADPTQNRLVFSEKAVTEAADKEARLALVAEKIKIGEKYAGKITAVLPYGVFVTLDNGAEGLLHISEISWEKVADVASLFTNGEEIEVVAIGVATDGKLNLSLKQLSPDPWAGISEKYAINQTVKGRVTQITGAGVFVELEEGIEGLIRAAKVPIDKAYEVDDKISVIIEALDTKNHKLGLSPVLTSKPIGYK